MVIVVGGEYFTGGISGKKKDVTNWLEERNLFQRDVREQIIDVQRALSEHSQYKTSPSENPKEMYLQPLPLDIDFVETSPENVKACFESVQPDKYRVKVVAGESGSQDIVCDSRA
mmetsp:Transcript_4173/g.8652  ORF Transcript_4173/g.8652 Transcript_4173/m.8652 type:complete len:115 (+) Transcript_4173:1766-2110(+)